MAEGVSILLADDEEDFLRYTATLFEKEGYRCDCVADADKALARLKEHRYDAVISDIRMPGNGDLRLVRETARLQVGVPVILVTAYPTIDTAVPAVSLPVKAYVEKPVEFRSLLSTVNAAILEARDHSGAGGWFESRRDTLGWFVQVLSSIVDELVASKSAFKSKRLGRLRSKIERTIRDLKSGIN